MSNWGPRVKTVETLSCSSTSGYMAMSLRRLTSCDFVTHLPVCSKEDFPIYREFSNEERKRLRELVKAEWYQEARSKSRFLRAFYVERELDTFSVEDYFWLLQEGYFYDPEHTYGQAEYFAAFREVANAYLAEVDGRERKFVLLSAAFARVHSDEPDKAQKLLKLAAEIPSPDVPIFDQYLSHVRACVPTPSKETCAPNHILRFE